MKHISLLLLFAFQANFSFAQSHADCDSALVICNKQPIVLPLIYGLGKDSMEWANAPCFNGFSSGEFSMAWIRWQVEQSGKLWFVIFPLNSVSDIDFILYQLPNGVCEEKTIMRCMAAGDIVNTSPCMGPTGLLPGATDVSSPPGCFTGADNYLAAVNVVAGSEYVLAINNFSSNVDSVRVEFCGTALLGCETEICDMVGTQNPDSSDDLAIGPVVPNPVTAKKGASIQIHAERPQAVTIRYFDARGQMLQEDAQHLNFGANTIQLETQQLPSGIYFVTILSDKAVVTRRLVKEQ